jgi:hypothetical protein
LPSCSKYFQPRLDWLSACVPVMIVPL